MKIKVGDIVAFNKLPDATWFDVIKINGFQMVVREHDTDYATQISDTSLVRKVL